MTEHNDTDPPEPVSWAAVVDAQLELLAELLAELEYARAMALEQEANRS